MQAELSTENLFSMKDFIEQFGKDDDLYHLLTAPTYAVKGTIKDLHKIDEDKPIKVNDVSIFQLIKPDDATHVEFQNRDFPFCIDELDGVATYIINNKQVSNTDIYPTEDTDVQIVVYNQDRNIDSYIDICPTDDYPDDVYINLEFGLRSIITYGKPGSFVEYPFELDGFSMHTYPSEMHICTNVTFDIDNTSEYDRYDFDFIVVIPETDSISPILYGFITRQFAGEEEKYIRVMHFR